MEEYLDLIKLILDFVLLFFAADVKNSLIRRFISESPAPVDLKRNVEVELTPEVWIIYIYSSVMSTFYKRVYEVVTAVSFDVSVITEDDGVSFGGS